VPPLTGQLWALVTG